MSMEKRRDELGRLLACLLVSRKGVSTIKDLERDYRDNEGRNIPYDEFGCHSLLDFFHSIKNHVKVESRSGQYILHPVVSDKIKHVNSLVSRQKPPRRSTPVRRRPVRSSRYFPMVADQKPFVPNAVQQEIAGILKANPSGVNKTYIAQRLEQSNAVSGTVDDNNVDEYLRRMPYTAVTRGNMVFPSKSLISKPTEVRQSAHAEFDGFEIVTPNDSEDFESSLQNNNTYEQPCYPAGYEEERETLGNDEDYFDELEHPVSSNINQSQHLPSTSKGKQKISSAEFIDRARSRYPQYETSSKENNNVHHNVETDEDDNDRHYSNADCIYQSDFESEVDIISERLKTRLQCLIKKNPDGIWCANLLQSYLKEYRTPLDYTELGFGSVCALAAKIPSVFHLHRKNKCGDFMLYDATEPLPPSANQSESCPPDDVWEYSLDDDDIDPFPAALPIQMSQKLIPPNVLTYGESVGQERIPETPDFHDGLSDLLEVYIADVYTPSLFWIHLRRKQQKLLQLMKSMHEFYQQSGNSYVIPPIILEKGLNCVCLFDKKWHRAIIKTVKPDGNVTLVFYDYGTTKTYPQESLRFLDRMYSNLPAQAIPCGLYNVKPVNDIAWTREVSAEFYSKVQDIPLFAMVVRVDKDNNSMLVSLVDTRTPDDFHINDWLIQEGLAESGSMGDTVVLECSYADNQVIETEDVDTGLGNVPLISPQSTLHENINSTPLRPPPGITTPAQPMNYAAFMDECLNERSSNNTEIGNSTSINANNVNSNNIPEALHNATFSSWLSDPVNFIQWWKQSIELITTVNKLLLSNSNSLLTQNATATSTNPIAEPSKHPFDRLEVSAIAKQWADSTERLKNIYSTSLPNSETLPNINGTHNNFSTLHEQDPFINKLTQIDDTTFEEKYEFSEQTLVSEPEVSITQDSDAKTVTMEGAQNSWLDSNPFKNCVFGNLNGKAESLSKTNLEYNDTIKPPVPPRNVPKTKIFYTGQPVMYDQEKIGKSKDVEVNFEDQDLTNHLLHKNAPFNLGESNSSESPYDPFVSEIDSQCHQSAIDNSFATSRKFSTNHTPCLDPRIISTTYPPPPPSYNNNEYQYKTEEPVSSQFTSPITSQVSKSALETVQSNIDLDVFDRVEPVATDTPHQTKRDKTLKQTKSDKSYKIKLVIPRFLPGEATAEAQTSPSEQDLSEKDHDSSARILKDQVTTDNNSSKFTNAEPKNIPPPESLSHPYQPPTPPLNTSQIPPLYPQMCHPQYGLNHPYHIYHQPPGIMPQPLVNQRVPLFKPNTHGLNPAASYWPTPQFFHPSFPPTPTNIGPPLPYSYAWSPYNSQTYNPRQTVYSRPRTSTPKSRSVPIVDSDKESVTLELNHKQKLEQDKQNMNTVQANQNLLPESKEKLADVIQFDVCEEANKSDAVNNSDFEACTLLEQLRGVNLATAKENVAENKTKKCVKENERSTPELSSGKTLPVVPPRNPVNNVSRDTTPRTITNVFKPIEVNGKTIYLFNIQNEGWVCTDEVLQAFTHFDNRNVVLKILEASPSTRFKINFMEVSRAQSPLLFNDLDSTTIQIPRMTNSKQIKSTLHLTALNSVIRLMFYLKIISEEEMSRSQLLKRPLPGSKLPALVELVTAYKSNDEYWTS